MCVHCEGFDDIEGADGTGTEVGTGAVDDATEARSKARGSNARIAVAYGTRGSGACGGLEVAVPAPPRMSAGGGRKVREDFMAKIEEGLLTSICKMESSEKECGRAEQLVKEGSARQEESQRQDKAETVLTAVKCVEVLFCVLQQGLSLESDVGYVKSETGVDGKYDKYESGLGVLLKTE